MPISVGNHRMLDLFGPGSNVSGRVVRNYEKLEEIINACRQLGLKIVLTEGTYDLLHVGHSRYLEKAKERGDILIVAVDSDTETKIRKGQNRPVVPEDERMEILCHLRHVDIVFWRDTDPRKWTMVSRVRPDVFVTTKGGFSDSDLRGLKRFCGDVVILNPQGEATTTARVRRVLVAHAADIRERIQHAFGELDKYLEELIGGEGD